MTAQELRIWFEHQPFQPFRVKLNNGENHDVPHPEMARIGEAEKLYVFSPSNDKTAHVHGLPVAIAIRNISTVEALPMQTT